MSSRLRSWTNGSLPSSRPRSGGTGCTRHRSIRGNPILSFSGDRPSLAPRGMWSHQGGRNNRQAARMGGCKPLVGAWGYAWVRGPAASTYIYTLRATCDALLRCVGSMRTRLGPFQFLHPRLHHQGDQDAGRRTSTRRSTHYRRRNGMRRRRRRRSGRFDRFARIRVCRNVYADAAPDTVRSGRSSIPAGIKVAAPVNVYAPDDVEAEHQEERRWGRRFGIVLARRLCINADSCARGGLFPSAGSTVACKVGRRGRPEEHQRRGRRCELHVDDTAHDNADDRTHMTHGTMDDRRSGSTGTFNLCGSIDPQWHARRAVDDGTSGGHGTDGVNVGCRRGAERGCRDVSADYRHTQVTYAIYHVDDLRCSGYLSRSRVTSPGLYDNIEVGVMPHSGEQIARLHTSHDGDGMAFGRHSGRPSLTKPLHPPSTWASQASHLQSSRGGVPTGDEHAKGPNGDDSSDQGNDGVTMRVDVRHGNMRYSGNEVRESTPGGSHVAVNNEGTDDATTCDRRHKPRPRPAAAYGPLAADTACSDRHRPRGAPKPLTRVGEATNPGPAAAVPSDAAAVEPGYVSIGPVSYPAPGKVGFHGDIVNQQEPGDGGTSGADQFGLRVDTTNATSWGALKRYLKRTRADIVLAQEHHLGPDEVPARSAWALRSGWHSLFAPAQKGEGQGWRAGVAIFARPAMGLAMPRAGGHVIVPHRAIGATVSPPGYRQFTAVSVYLEDGKGVSKANLDILAEVGSFLAKQGDGASFIIGGDLQAKPSDIAAVGFASKVDGEIVASGSARGTCRSSRTSSEIDYFIIHKQLVLGIKDITTVEDAGTRPHVPVRVEFRPRLTAAKAMIVRSPPRIGTEMIYGPVPAPPCWVKVRAEASALIAKVKEEGFHIDEDFRAQYERCYAAWADGAELEIAAANADMVAIPKLGLRGRRPVMKWRSVLPERPPKPPEGEEEVTQWRNVANVLTDLMRIAHLVTPLHDSDIDEEGEGFIEDHDDDDIPRALDDLIDQLSGIQVWDGVGIVQDTHIEGHDGKCISFNDVVIRLRAFALAMRAASRNSSGQGLNAMYNRLQAATAGRMASILRELDEDVTSAANAAAARLKNREAQEWRDWISQNLAAGARNAHRFLRLPIEWQPSTVVTEDGVITADPVELIRGYAKKYNVLWNVGGEHRQRL